MIKRRIDGALVAGIILAVLSPDLHGQTDADRDKRQTVAKPISIDMVRHDVKTGWRQVERKQDRVVYMGDPGDIHYMKLNQGILDLPKFTEVEALQNHFRRLAQKEDGGIISVSILKLQGIDTVVYTTKEVRKQIRGYRYVSRCVIPVENSWFEVRMDAIEMTPAVGGRESVITVMIATDAEYEPIPLDAAALPGIVPGKSTGQRIKGWFKDPFDPKFDSAAMCSVSDDKKYDKQFPDHPLSRLRKTFPDVLQQLQIDPSLGGPKK